MNIKNLQVGQVIKNYKELCGVLEVDIKKSGSNSHKAQLKEFSRYFDYEKQGQKYIITEIFDEIKEKDDRRRNNKGGNNSIFADDIETLMLYMLSTSKNQTVTISKGQLYRILNMINENYLIARNNIPKLSEITEIPQDSIYEFYDYNSTKLRDTVERNLRRLRNKSLISWYNSTTIAKYETTIFYNELNQPIIINGQIQSDTRLVHKVANDDELKLILDSEYIVLQEMGLSTIQEVFLKGKWRQFKKEVESKLKENNTNILFYYDTYTITFNRNNIDHELSKLVDIDKRRIETNINNNMLESIKKSTMKRHDKACMESGLETNQYKQDKYFEQEKIEYVINQEQLTLTLICQNAKSLKNEFEKSINYKKVSNINKIVSNTDDLEMDWEIGEEVPF